MAATEKKPGKDVAKDVARVRHHWKGGERARAARIAKDLPAAERDKLVAEMPDLPALMARS
ncbi:MAG: hypothetical protein R3D70_09355 [Rhizobiaceae bacterium]